MNYLALGGIAAIITACWGYIQTGWAYAASYVVETVEITKDGPAFPIVFDYCNKYFKKTQIGPKMFMTPWVQLNKYEHGIYALAEVAPSKASLYWDGWKPIWVSRGESVESSANNTPGKIEIRLIYFRWTFNAELLMQKMIDLHNDKYKFNVSQQQNRFYISTRMGLRKIPIGQSLVESGGVRTSSSSYIHSERDLNGARLIKYSVEDIGSKKSDDKLKPLQTVAMPTGGESFVNKAKHWLNSSKWFSERGLTWKLGAVFHGNPGTGKTKTVRAIAEELDIPVISFDFSTMDNREFNEYWEQLDTPCIALFEDFDSVYKGREPVNDKIEVTFDTILKAIDGVKKKDGVLTIVTTNHVESLDPALGGINANGVAIRPGRIDMAVEFGPLSIEGKHQMAERILADLPQLQDKAILDSDGFETGATFERRCIDLAQEYWLNSEVLA